MSKASKIGIVLLLALICAAMAAYGIYQYCTPLKTTIYLFNNNYEAGTVISANMLTSLQVDASVVVNGRQASTNEQYVTAEEINSYLSSGDSLINSVYRGQALTPSTLVRASGTDIEKNMRSDAIAITIPINNIRGVTTGLRVGSRVNVYTSADKTTEMFLQNMRIIKVTKNDSSLSSITFECTQEEAVKMIYATEFTSLYLGLVDSANYEPYNGAMSYGYYS